MKRCLYHHPKLDGSSWLWTSSPAVGLDSILVLGCNDGGEDVERLDRTDGAAVELSYSDSSGKRMTDDGIDPDPADLIEYDANSSGVFSS